MQFDKLKDRWVDYDPLTKLELEEYAQRMTAEQHLWLGVIVRAIWDLMTFSKDTLKFHQARRWVKRKGDDPYSFDWACRMARINAANKIRKCVESPLAEDKKLLMDMCKVYLRVVKHAGDEKHD